MTEPEPEGLAALADLRVVELGFWVAAGASWLAEIIASQTLDVWAERFDRKGVWWAPAQGPADVLEDPQLAANDGFLEARDAATGEIRRSVNGPVSFSDLPLRTAPAAPTLGEHTDEVFAELATRRRPAGSVSPEPGPGPAAPGR